MDTAIYAQREQAAAANRLRNLLSRQQNSSASFLCLLRCNIGTDSFLKSSINTMIFIENIVIASDGFALVQCKSLRR
jgi:hypothetical protein